MYSFYFYFRELKNKISNLFFPKQKWLTKTIPRSWKDKPELIRDFLYLCLQHYVEEEKCFEFIVWDNNDTHKEVAAFIKECYKWIVEDRPKLVKEIDDIITNGSEKNWEDFMERLKNAKKTYEETYPNLDNLEKELDEKDTYFLSGIIKNRGYLWV
jgi:hypothetical protein